MRVMTKSLLESLKESTSGNTIKDYAMNYLDGYIDNDVTDTEIDMTVAFSFDFNETPEDSYDEFMNILGQRTNIVRVHDSEYGATLECDFSSVFKPYNEQLKEFFNMDNSEFDEDEAYYEAVVNLEPLISGNAGESTYKELINILNSKPINEGVELESGNDFDEVAAYLYQDAGNEVDRIPSREEMDYIADVTEEEYKKLYDAVKTAIENVEGHFYNGMIELSNRATMNSLNTIEDESKYDDANQTYAELRDKALEDFTAETGVGVWQDGRSGRHIVVEDDYYNARDYAKLCDIQEKYENKVIDEFNKIYSDKLMNESDKYEDEEVDYHSISNKDCDLYKMFNDAAKKVFGVYFVYQDNDYSEFYICPPDGFGNGVALSFIERNGKYKMTVFGNMSKYIKPTNNKIFDSLEDIAEYINTNIRYNVKESTNTHKMNYVKYNTNGYIEATDGYYKGERIVNYKEKDFKKGTSVLMPFMCDNCGKEFYIKSNIHDFFEQGDFDDPYETPKDTLQCPKCKDNEISYNGEVLIKEPRVRENVNESYTNKEDLTDEEIIQAAKYLLNQDNHLATVWGGVNAVENRIWHYFKEKKGWTKFPSNLYSRIRKVIYHNPEMKKYVEKIKEKYDANKYNIKESEDLSIYTDFSDFPKEVAKGETPEERKNIFYRCYVANPKEDEMNKWTIKDLVEYIKETDEYYNKDYKYIFKCCLLCGLTKEEAKELCGEKLNESSTEEYWDATEIKREAFVSLMRFNFGSDANGNNYIITIDANEAKRFYAENDEEAIKIFDDMINGVNNRLDSMKESLYQVEFSSGELNPDAKIKNKNIKKEVVKDKGGKGPDGKETDLVIFTGTREDLNKEFEDIDNRLKRLDESVVDDAVTCLKQAEEDNTNIDKNIGIRQKQLINNIEYIIYGLVNLIENGEEEPLKSYDTLVDYVYNQLFDIKDDGKGNTTYRKGVCDDLKYLGKDYIMKEIKRIGDEAGVVNTKLTESVDEDSLAKFIKDSVDKLQNSSYTNCKYNLDDKFAVYVGWSDGYDAEETNEYEIHSKENPTYCINAVIGIRNEADWSDLDYINRPYYEAGDVFEGEWTVSPSEDYSYLANSILKTYSYMLELLNTGELLTEDIAIDDDPDLDREQVNYEVDYWTDVDNSKQWIYSNAESEDKSDAESMINAQYRDEFPNLTFKMHTDGTMWYVDFIGKYQDICDALINLGWYNTQEINKMTDNGLIKPYQTK